MVPDKENTRQILGSTSNRMKDKDSNIHTSNDCV